MRCEADELTVGVGGRLFALPAGLARGVVIAPPLAPLPLAAAPIEGLADFDGRPLVQVDACRLLDGRPGDGRMVVAVRLPAGQVALRVDRVQAYSADASLPPFPFELCPPLTAVAEEDRRPVVAADPRLALFVMIRHGRRVAVPAAAIERVGRIEEVRALADGGALVRLDGELLAAVPVPSRLAESMAPPPAVWAAVVTPAGGRVAWVAEAVEGMLAGCRSRLRSVVVPGHEPALWYEEEDGGLVEVADPAGTLEGSPWRPPVEHGFRRPLSQGLRLCCGPYCCLLPLHAAGHVHEHLDRLALRRTAAKELPVYDAGRLLGLPGIGRKRGVEVILGRLRAVLAVDRVAPAPAELGEALPLPAVPAAVAGLFDAVHRHADGWIYRIRVPGRGRMRPTGWFVRPEGEDEG